MRARRTAESLCWLLLMLAVAVVIIAVASVLRPAHAHLHDRPDLNNWTMSLKNGVGVPCCDGADATPLVDADWKVNEAGHYVVRIEGTWVEVPDSAVVKGPNKYGQTLVWYFQYPAGPTYVRCFLPAAGA